MEQEQRPLEASAPWEPLELPAERRRTHENAVALEELARARRIADDALRQRAELVALLAVASHDLRTPINAIIGYNDLLLMELHGPLTPAQRAALERVRSSAQQLVGLVADTLSFARHEAGRLECRKERVHIGETLDEAAGLVQHAFAAKAIAYEATVVDGLAAIADRERVLQILRAILATAAHQTRANGRIVADARLDRGGPRGSRRSRARRVCVLVRDTGPGFSPAALAHIFDPYAQVTTEGRASGSVGLGLAISRNLARAMGGDLVAESVEGRGTTFELSLPSAR